MTALSGPAPAPQTRSYQDVYIENGRWYGTYRKGKYMFPVDEVSPICPDPLAVPLAPVTRLYP